MDIKVSIIIPVFNAAKYISQCIQSVIDQSLSEIEIIIINDGSTDESKSSIQAFASKDQRIMFIDGKNKGVSAARNKGLEIATGEWITFVDADDWLETDMYKVLYNAALTEDADIIICNANNVSKDKFSKRLRLNNEIIDFESNRQAAFIDLMRFKYDYSNWNKMYSARLIKQHRINFSESLYIYEDLLFNLSFWQYCRKGIVISNSLYNYRIHTASVMNLEKLDATTEYKKLAVDFSSICDINGWNETLNNFQLEIRRGFYYRHLPLMVVRVRKKRISLTQKARMLASELSQFPTLVYNYNREEMKGLQFVKKILLKHKQFYLFSIIEVIRS